MSHSLRSHTKKSLVSPQAKCLRSLGNVLLSLSGLTLLVFSGGCDDKVTPAANKYEVVFIYPESDVTLGCGDDLSRATPDVIDISMSVNVTAPEGERDDLIVELSADPVAFSAQRRTITEGGRVIFTQLPLEPGEYNLTAKLLNGTVERARATREVRIQIDRDSPLCGVVNSSLNFVAPVDGMVVEAADDLDQDLTNGVQVAVEIDVEGPLMSVGNLVEVQVNGADPQRAPVVEGVARFEQVTLPLSGEQELTALATGPNGLLETTINVTVNASSCELSLSPEPREGCDLGTTVDLDTERPGLQAELSALSTCSQVLWTVNGQAYPPADVIDGEAKLVVTLTQGENTISAQAQSDNGLSAEVPTYVLDVDLIDPDLSVDSFEAIGVNRRDLTEAIESVDESGEPILNWRILGFTSDLPEDSSVQVEIDHEGEVSSTEVTIDSEGRFTFNLAGDYLCDRELTLSALDRCGGRHTSPAYSFCFDGVTPRLSITEPDNLTLINTDDDEGAEGLQTEMVVRVEDSRDGVDYPIEIQCVIGSGGPPEVLSDAPMLLSELSEAEGEAGAFVGAIPVSLPRAERYSCRPYAMTGPNEPILATSIFRVITDEPIFEILDPVVIPAGNGRDYACFSDSLLIGGIASQFSDEGSQLNFTLSTEAGQVARFGQLTAQGNHYYSAELDLSNQQLADGRYFLEITGVSGSIDVSVIPSDPIPVLIDNEEPIIGPLLPADGRLTLAQDRNNDLGDCIQAAVDYTLSDASAERVCFRLNGGAPNCTDRLDQGVVTSSVMDFLPGDNQLQIEVFDCGLATRTFDFTLTTEGCQAPLRITNLSDGVGVTLNSDEDAEEEGIQVTLALEGDPGESVAVTVDATGGASTTFGPVELDGSGLGVLGVTLPSQENTPLELNVAPSSMSRAGQVLSVTSYQLTPQLSIRPFEGAEACLNQSVKDLSAQPGFQIRLIVDAEGLSAGASPRFSVYCANDEGGRSLMGQFSGTLINLGQSALITSSLLTLPDGSCEVEVEARDVTEASLVGSIALQIDRQEPEISLASPTTTEPLNLLNDADANTPGIQFIPEFSVCGAAGAELEVSTDPPQASGVMTANVEEDACTTIQAPELTFVNGDQLLTASATDRCGNTAVFEQNIIGNTGVTLVVTEPDDQALISAGQDLDPDRADCQLQVSVASTGFTTLEGVTFALCASQQPGELSPLCGAQPDVSQGGCVPSDEEGRSIVCPITLSDGEHDLSIVSRQNGVDLRSNPVSVFVDCTPPSVVSLQIAEDLNEDGCVNSQERANFNSAGDNATFNLSFEVEGLTDGSRVSVRALPEERSLGQAEVIEGRGALSGITLEPGEYQVYLSGSDAVGNELPGTDSSAFVFIPLLIDTVAPEPVLLRPTLDQCLGFDDDLEARDGAQYQPQVSTGATNGEVVSLSLSLDGVVVERETSALNTYTFNTVEMIEGPHNIAVVSEDACGNAGSIAGFNFVGDRPDWQNPQAVPISVDLTAPALILSGVTEGQILTSDDDANASPADGFQVNVAVNVSGLEAGREVRIYSGEERIPTFPIRLDASGINGQQLSATLTLPPGPHALSARAVDACDNLGTTDPVSITIDVEGCNSQLTNLVSGQLFGPAQGEVTSEGRLRLNIAGLVDLLDPACADAQAELVLNGAELIGSSTIDRATGQVNFVEVSIPEGEHTLTMRVRLNNEETISLGKSVRVDLTAPSEVVILTPALTDGRGQVLVDTNPSIVGQQFNLVAQVTEIPATTTRTARLSIDGVGLPNVEVPVPNADGVAEVRIEDINAPPRVATYQLCIRDELNNERCSSFEIEADPSAPTGITFTSTLINPRTPLVSVSFIAPGDDQSGGDQVIAYEARWSRAEIDSEITWDNAHLLNEFSPTVLPGAQETLSVSGLPPNDQVYLSLRARDNVGRLSPARSSLVDTRLSISSATLTTVSNGVWPNILLTEGITEGNPLSAIGDFDGDGYDDVGFGLSRADGVSGAAVIFGGDDLNQMRTQNLEVPDSMDPSFFGIQVNSLGDVNGDGAPDLSVAGYTAAFSSAFAIYFGCPRDEPCNALALRTADVILTTNNTLRSSIASAGDFAARLGDGYDDIIIGGGRTLGPYVDPEMAVVIEGRDVWPETIDVTNGDEMLGVYALFTGVAKTGSQVASAGDLNGDGASEVLFSAGGNIDQVFVVYGGAPLDASLINGVWIYNNADQSSFLEIDNPCPQLGSSSFGTLIRGGVDLNDDLSSDFVIANRVDESLIVMDSNLQLLDCFERGEEDFSNPFDIAGDINGDQVPDLVVANRSPEVAQAEVAYVFYNNGSGQFGADLVSTDRAPSMSIVRPTGTRKLAVSGAGDMNNDNQVDLVVLTFDDVLNVYRVSVLY